MIWDVDLVLRPAFVLMHRSTRYKNGSHQIRPSPRHAGPVDVESDCAWPRARVRQRATARTSVTRRGPGAGRVALPGIAPARKSRPSGCGLERDRDRARGEVLSPDAQRAEAAGNRNGRLAATNRCNWTDPWDGRWRCAMSWWTRLWRRGQMEAQLEKELNFHLEQHMSQLVARGRAPDEARRQARLALGGPEQVKEKCRDARGTRWLEDLLQDTRYALRTFRQKPGFTLVALLLLALGIGATTVMFAVINSVLLRPLSYPEPDRLLTLRVFTERFGELWGFSNLDFGDAKRESQTLALAAWTYSGGTISVPGDPEYVNGRQISAELFSTLGISPVQGRAFRPDEDRPGAPPVAIISYGLWQRDFGGDPSAIGRSLVYEGKPYTVVGIAPASFQLDGDADGFTPLEQRQNTDPRMQNRSARFLRVLARLRPGFRLAEGRAELALIARHLAGEYPKSNADLGMIAYPLQKERSEERRVGKECRSRW